VLDHRLKIDADVFYLYRQDAQIKSSFQSAPTNPDYFVYYTGNAASGRNYGLESDAEWRATDRVTLGADLGLLQTHFENFMQQQGSSGATSVSVSRELANAPHWQAAVNATYRDPRGPFARIDVTGMGGYYFDLPPNYTTSKPYGLLNAKIGWETPEWSAYLCPVAICWTSAIRCAASISATSRRIFPTRSISNSVIPAPGSPVSRSISVVHPVDRRFVAARLREAPCCCSRLSRVGLGSVADRGAQSAELNVSLLTQILGRV
jgi:hypothetical protein